MKKNTKLWFKAAGIRALKTVAETALATLSTTAVISAVDWKLVFSSAVVSGIISILMSVKGLPEVNLNQ